MSHRKRRPGCLSQERSGTRVNIAVIAVLIAVAIAQLANSALRLSSLDPDRGFVKAGHDLSAVSVPLSDGTVAALGDGHRSLLLVFDPDCVHSNGIAPKWSAWLSTLDPDGTRIVAVSPGSLSQAIGYARDQQWSVKVGTLGGTEGGGNALGARTPWVFALDQDGRVVEEGHGSRLLEVPIPPMPITCSSMPITDSKACRSPDEESGGP